MKTLSTQLAAHIAGTETSVVMCIKLTLIKFQPAIKAISNANPAVVETLWAHGLVTGDSARIVKVRGPVGLNDQEFLITRIDDTHFSIPVDTTAYPVYTAKGEARKILGFTSFPKDVTLGSIIYKAAAGYMPKSIAAKSDLSVDTIEVISLMQNKALAQAQGILLRGLNDEDLRVGRLDHARVELFEINWADLTQGRVMLPGSGNIGQVITSRGTFEAELRGKIIFLQEVVGDLYSILCRADLGDDIDDYRIAGFGCHVRLDPPVWAPSTAYTVRPSYDAALGSVVKPSIYNGYFFECTVAGTSDVAEPAWVLGIGGITTEATGVTWIAIQALTVEGSVTSVIDSRFFSDTTRTEAPMMGTGVTLGTTQYPILRVNQSSRWLEIAGDETSFFVAGHTFAVVGSPGNDGTYTINSATLTGGRTRIAVVEALPNGKAGGSITGPIATSTSFFSFGKLTFLTGANIGISKEVKDFTLTAFPIAAISGQIFKVAGDVTGSFSAGQRIAVAGSTANDGQYDVTLVAYNSGIHQTEITVSQTIPSTTADGSILGAGGQFEMFERFPFAVQVGDSYIATAGCDKARATCKAKFRNIYNFRGEPDIPGTDAALLFPDSHS